MAPDRSSPPRSVLDAWDQHVEETLDTAGGPSVQTLLALADPHGDAPREDVLHALGRHVVTSAVQRAWTDWRAVTDRDELRLRLEVLSGLPRIEPGLNDFVLFFFRSSDPALYQAAAQALGHHASDQPELIEYLKRFAAQRSVSLTAPLSLNGERSRRRILIAQAARRARGNPDVPVLATSDPEALLTGSPLDLTVALQAVRIVVEGATGAEDGISFAYDLVTGLAENAPVASADPSLLRAGGHLLIALGDRAPDRSARAWTALLHRVVAPIPEAEDTFAAHLQRLNRLDELARTAVRLPSSIQDRIDESLGGPGNVSLRHFLRYRAGLWTERDGLDRPPFATADAIDLDAAPEGLRVLLRAEQDGSAAPSIIGTGSGTARRLDAFLGLLRTMNTKADWLRRPVEERALIAFSALDLSRYLSLPAAPVDATFEAHDFPDLREDDDRPTPSVPLRGRAGPATFRILLRLSDWEATGPDRLIDTSLLHQITDAYVLMMLLPSDQEADLAPRLADAVEHQLRLNLRTRPAFQPEQFLYETSIRAPHPQFYEHLRRLCWNRTYLDAQGRDVPVAAIVDHLRMEAQALTDTDTPRGDADRTAWPGDTPLSDRLQYVRHTLQGIETNRDLIAGLEDLGEVLDPKRKDVGTGSRGLVDLIAADGGPTTPLVHRSAARTAPPTYRSVRDALQDHAIELREALPNLQPPTIEDAQDVRDDALDIEDILDEVERQIVPVLGVVEGTMLTHTIRHLRTLLQSWTEVLTGVHAQWRTLVEGNQTGTERAIPLFDEILNRASGPRRTRLVSLLAQSLVPAAAAGERPIGSRPASWTRSYEVLTWALASPQLTRLSEPERNRWVQAFTRQWRALLTHAMDAGYESRVRHLATDDAFEPARRQPDAPELLEAARTWFLDRYHLPAARKLTQILRPSPVLGGFFGTATAFLAHFSRVWLALLLGAILMLDFGDAWTAMAEAGDVTSVAITFVVGVIGTLGYLFIDLRGKVQRAPTESVGAVRWSRWTRLVAFLGVCLTVTVILTSTLWVLLSGTGQVVEGPGARLHIIVWTGFALFVGIFFGLLAESA